VTSVHQTAAGKMIFGRLEQRGEQAVPLMRQAAAAGREDGNGGAHSDAVSRVENSARLPEPGSTPDRQPRPYFPGPDAA
jgi:hypothetical protein